MNTFFRNVFRFKNKILAITFISLAILNYLGYFFFCEIITGWTYLRSDPESLWNLLIYSVVYGIILVGNINNSNKAFSGISMFVFMLTLDAIVSLLNFLYSFLGFVDFLSIIELVSIVVLIGEIVAGIYYYINISKYLNYRSENFKKVRGLGILFTSLVILRLLPILIVVIYSSSFLSLFLFGTALSEAFAAISCIFTVERIKR